MANEQKREKIEIDAEKLLNFPQIQVDVSLLSVFFFNRPKFIPPPA